jgi:hypothetical protein
MPAVRKLGNALLDTVRYLELNADSMPDYGKRYRNGSRISTGFAESAVVALPLNRGLLESGSVCDP